jgi:hypothetical protein
MRARKFTALLALTGTACTTMRVQHAPPAVTVGTKQPDKARLRLADGTSLDVYQPMLNGDSIVGFRKEERVQPRERVAVATADVVSVSVPKISTGRTILAVTAAVLGVAIIAGLTSPAPQQQQSSCEPTSTAQSAPLPA